MKYYEWLKAQGLSPQTIRNRIFPVQNFLKLYSNKDIKDLTNVDILVTCVKEGMIQCTDYMLDRYNLAINSYKKYLEEYGVKSNTLKDVWEISPKHRPCKCSDCKFADKNKYSTKCTNKLVRCMDGKIISRTESRQCMGYIKQNNK